MTTDTKAVARWEWVEEWRRFCAQDDGRYMLFVDHEQVVAELSREIGLSEMISDRLQSEIDRLRSALAANSAEVEGLAKDAERWRYLEGRLLAADFTMDGCVGLTFELPDGSAVSANAGATVDAAMEKSNEHQDQ